MKMEYSSEQIRKLRTSFWNEKEKNHKYLVPSSLLSDKQDKTVLFNVAGMQQLVPYLTGKKHPLGERLENIQGCVRTNDIEEVGDERHLTYFEMMGNRSLGDYFKKESLEWSIEFLHKKLGISLEKIGVTVFGGTPDNSIPRDDTSELIAKELGVTHIKAIPMIDGESDNFWGPAGAVGPCGPCSEIYIDRGPAYGPEDRDLGVNDRYIEVWNNVFMEFYKDDTGQYTKLSQQNVDTGMGLERLCMVMQQKETVFETDLFEEIIQTIEKLSGIQYPPYLKKEKVFDAKEKEITRSMRIITDHCRTATLLLAEGLLPSNEGRGYVLRRVIRRMWFHLQKLSNTITDIPNTVSELVNAITNKYGNIGKSTEYNVHYPLYEKISLESNTIHSGLAKEISAFDETLKKGKKFLDDAIEQSKNNKTLTGEMIFVLYDTHGIPVELTQDFAQEHGIMLDIEGFEKKLKNAQELSRSSTKDKFKKGVDRAQYLQGIPATKFIGYDQLNSSDSKLLKTIPQDDYMVFIFDQTPFYAEGGGQTGDKGIFEYEGKKYQIYDVQNFSGVYLHFGK